MPWRKVSIMDQRREFIAFARQEGANISELCRRFGISRTTAYKWLRRAQQEGETFQDRSRRPHRQPRRTPPEMEQRILEVRARHPAWGARKICSWLKRRGVLEVPSASTIHAVLQRHDCLLQPTPAQAYDRFEHPRPNTLWQMDFKGHVPLGDGRRLHPLAALDDHSRFCVTLEACPNEQRGSVQASLERAFRRYGLPGALYMDNGSPWGTAGRAERWTRFDVWLLKLGVRVIHGRPYHPQGRGKIERFHRTLKSEALSARPLADLHQARRRLRRWRHTYNFERPHEQLGMRTPAEAYTPSSRPFPSRMPEIEYDEGEIVRKVSNVQPEIWFHNRTFRVPKAFLGEHLAIRPTQTEGCYQVCFGAVVIQNIDLKNEPD